MDNYLKLTHVLPRFPYFSDNSIVGGAANALFNLMKIQSKNAEITLITSIPDNQDKKIDNPYFTISNLDINLLGYSKRYGLNFTKRIVLYPVKNKIFTDLIHGHSGFFDYIIPSIYLSAITGKPLVYSVYCPIISDSKKADYFGRTVLLSKLADKVLKVYSNK